MLSQAESIIYLANQRGCSQVDGHRSYHTFNFGTYFNEDRKSFANLKAINDDTLKEGSTIKMDVKEDTLIMLLPIVGSLNNQNLFEQCNVEVGQGYHFFAPKDSAFEITNPYRSELINFLHVWLTPEPSQHSSFSSKSEFDLDLYKNKLIPLHSVDESSFRFIGKFDGRKEGIFSLRNSNKGAFVFIIEGAFEVQNRLLQPRDGLAMWNTREIEFEALSNDAILMIVES